MYIQNAQNETLQKCPQNGENFSIPPPPSRHPLHRGDWCLELSCRTPPGETSRPLSNARPDQTMQPQQLGKLGARMHPPGTTYTRRELGGRAAYLAKKRQIDRHGWVGGKTEKLPKKEGAQTKVETRFSECLRRHKRTIASEFGHSFWP